MGHHQSNYAYVKLPSINYRGWEITYNPHRPPTGTYRAESFGIGLSAHSLDSIKNVIDLRILDYPDDGHGRKFIE